MKTIVKNKQNILLSILGTSPQILTETIYALTQHEPKFIPDKVIVLTTGVGADQCSRGLFQMNGGWFNKLCKTYELNNIDFSIDDILVTKGEDGLPIADIRTPEENQIVANHISKIIQEITSKSNTVLHVSIAGGRKTMGFYAGYALSMFGRAEDKLSHVLVQEKYEGEPEFYFPTPYSEIFVSKRNPNEYYDKKDAEVRLASLPFVRMRNAIDSRYFSSITNFDRMIDLLQTNIPIEQGSVEINLASKTLTIMGIKIDLTFMNFLFYYWLSKRHLADKRSPNIKTDGNESLAYSGEFYSCLDDVYDENNYEHEAKTEELDKKFINGMKQRFIDDRKTDIKEQLTIALGVNHEYYIIKMDKKNKENYFGFNKGIIKIVYPE